MDKQIDELLSKIETAYGDEIQRGSRHYLEVNLAEHARKLGYASIDDKYKIVNAIIPLKNPQKGMNYAEFDSGMAVPGYLAQASNRKYRDFIPNDSMICNFC